MIKLLFGDTYSILTTLAVIGLLSFALMRITKLASNISWGKSIALFIAFGLGVSFLSAMRDGYAGEAALFSMTSMQSDICSIAGTLVLLTGLLSLFVRKDAFRRGAFMTITALFLTQVLVIEISRISILL